MKKSKAELLAELEELGVHKDGRKVRTDKGSSRQPYARTNLSRADKGVPRDDYTVTPKVHQRIFTTFLSAHLTPDGMGDNLTRDINGIFPPNVTSYYKIVKRADGTTYMSSTKRRNHPEQLRWNWWMAEYEADPEGWAKRITDWYSIQEHEISMWTYNEWAWAYVDAIGGHPNHHSNPNRIILSYEHYLNGFYGYPKYDEKGDLIWTK